MFSKIKYYHFNDLSIGELDKIDFGKAKIIVVISKDEHTEAHTEMISKLLENGLSIQKEEYAIIPKNQELDLALARNLLGHKKGLLLSFEIAFNQLGFKFDLQKYQLYPIHKLHILKTDNASKIYNDKVLKGRLWNAIKHLKEEF